MSGKLSEYYYRMSKSLEGLNKDLAEKANKASDTHDEKDEKDEEKSSKSKRVMGSHGVEPFTRLRSNIEEAKKAEENPEYQFIIDRVNDIFKG